MAGRKKSSKGKTYTQRLAQVATMGMPAPVQQVATSRLGSKSCYSSRPRRSAFDDATCCAGRSSAT